MKKEEIIEECKEIIESVCKKYNYNDKDIEGNDSLKTILTKVIPIMLEDSKLEDRKLFYQMLEHTPIVIKENLTQEEYDEMTEQYLGKDINKHIIDEEIDLGEYGKGVAKGAYVSEPVFDENMNLQGKKSFIYMQKVTPKAQELFGTDINISHLIHELGHAWHAEKEQYVMQEDGTLKERIGTAEFIYSFTKTDDDKFIKQCTNVTGLMIEEGMNTIEEEKAMAKYLELSLEEMQKEYRKTLIPSTYQGYISDMIDYMLDKLGREDFENFRLYGQEEGKDNINNLMRQTNYWKNRETEILPSSESQRSYYRKQVIIDRINIQSVQEFFKEYEDVYFPDISNMTPLEKIENVLEQFHNMNMVKYNMGLDNYKDFIERLGFEGYGLINQTADLKKEQELLQTISNVRSSELSDITKETKNILENTQLQDKQPLEKGEEEK